MGNIGERSQKKGKKKKAPKTNATTYFGCTVAPGDSCGAPFHAVPPSDALLASCALLHLGVPGNAGRHRTPEGWDSGASWLRRSR